MRCGVRRVLERCESLQNSKLLMSVSPYSPPSLNELERV